MKLAIVADWLPTYGGAEHVIAALHSVWSEAPLFTTVAERSCLGPLKNADIRTDTLLQSIFHLTKRHQYLLPWMPKSIEAIDLRGFDVILSSSHAVGKGIIPSSGSVHVCYCHTPMRYAWEMEDEYLEDFRIRGPLKSLVKAELKRLRRWDLSTAKRVDHFIANSAETKERIKKIYGRDSVVVTPPVDDRFFEIPLELQTSNLKPQTYFLAIGRLVPYKRFDLLIELANQLKLPLKIGGTGSDFERLKKLAGPTVEFLGFVKDADLPELYSGAEALLFPQVEDAGIVPLEAQACGVPVIAFGQGGVLDVVKNGVTGLFVPAQTVEAFASAIHEFKKQEWNRSAIRGHAENFRLSVFQERMGNEVRLAHERFKVDDEKVTSVQ